MDIKSDGARLRNLLVPFILSSLIAAFFVFAVIKIAVTHQIYIEITFYLAIIIVFAWLGILALIPYMSRKLHFRKVVMTVLFSIVIVAGAISSVVLGDTWFNQGALLFFIAGAILCLFGTFMFSVTLITHRRGNINHQD